MAKDDWYFLIGTIIGVISLLGLLGMDWKLVGSRVSLSSQTRQMILLSLVAGSLFMCALGWYRLSTRSSTYSSDMSKLKSVRGRVYINEEVPLDGFDYRNCTFTNVTFVYQGTGVFNVSSNTISGTRLIKSGSAAVMSTVALLKGLGILRADFPVMDSNKQPIIGVEAPKIVP